MTTARPERIVCGTDFSDNAAWALRWAAALAKRSGGDIDLVTAIAPVTSNFPELATDTTVLDDALYDGAVERLAETAAAAERELGVQVQSHVVHAEVPAPIAAYAQEMGARLIVLGAHNRPPLERWLLGSVADRTIRAATCPVVVVPPPAPDRRGARPAWAEQQLEPQRAAASPSRPLRVLVGFDGGAGGHRALGFARQLRAKIPADVTFLHLYWPLGEYQRLGVQGSRDLFEADPDVVRNLEPSLRDRIGTLPGTGSMSLSIRPAWGEPAANLLLAAEEGEHDLLIVGAEQRHGLSRIWHPSTSRRLVRGALTVPVVCVPAEPPSSRPSPAAALPALPEQPHFSVVLVPTDLSAAGNAAVPYAYALLGGRGGVIELCHIRSRGVPVSELEAQLRALVPPSAQERGITTHVSVIDGGPAAEAIVQASERLGVDVISLGSHGAGALARVVLGSVAESVVRNSRKPVLLVRSAPP